MHARCCIAWTIRVISSAGISNEVSPSTMPGRPPGQTRAAADGCPIDGNAPSHGLVPCRWCFPLPRFILHRSSLRWCSDRACHISPTTSWEGGRSCLGLGCSSCRPHVRPPRSISRASYSRHLYRRQCPWKSAKPYVSMSTWRVGTFLWLPGAMIPGPAESRAVGPG